MVNNPNPTHRDLLNAGVAPEVELIDTRPAGSRSSDWNVRFRPPGSRYERS
jgi:hypothetical protein